MKKQVIMISTDIYPSKTGGLEIFNFHLFRSLKNDSSIDFQFFTTCKKSISKGRNFNKINYGLFGLQRFGLGGISGFLSIILSKRIKIKKIDKIYIGYTSSFSLRYIVMLLLFKFLLNKNYILHIHGGRMKSWKKKDLNFILFKNAYKIAGVSNLICSEYSKRTKTKVDFLPPSVPIQSRSIDINLFKRKLKIPLDSKIILNVGSIKKLKDPGTLLKAFDLLSEDIIKKYNPHLVFCGDGPLLNFMKKKSASLNNAKNISFLGNIKYENIDEYYQISDIYVIPSHFEGNPISLNHALNRNLICIGSDVNGINSVIKNNINGYLFQKNNFTELKNILEDILNNFSYHKKTLKKNKSSKYNYQDFIKEFKIYIS